MNPTIQKMQQDLETFRASKRGGVTPTATAPAPEAPAPVEAPVVSSIAQDLENFRQQKATGTVPKKKIPKEGGSTLASFAKGLFSAPATLIARPFQAAAAVAGVSNEDIDKFTESIPGVGGLIAPTPKSAGDVLKDVGRGAQTVALGLAPISGGALFGAGTSLEQGDDLLSAETAFNTVLGAAGGKIIGMVGQPLLNASGKVIGKITPKILKDVAAGGAEAITKFAADHQLLGGIAAKPSAALARGAQAIDDTIEQGASKLFQGTKNVLKEQFPDINPVAHYQAKNANDIIRPTTVNEPKYSKATRVYNDAKAKGIDLDEVATKRGIIHDQLAESGRYNTLDTVDNLRQGNYEVSDRIARPAIKAAEGGTRRVPVSEVREAMVKRVREIPPSQLDDDARELFIRKIERKYSDTGAAARANPDGYTLTKLHDNRIVSAKNGKYKVGQPASDALNAQLSREEGRVFAEIFDNTIPEEVGMKAFRKELEQNFLLADYLESLHQKAVPAGITKKAVRLFGRAVTATVGGKVGGFPGSILGAQYGDMLFNTFNSLPNPIKMKVLQSVKLEDPKVFGELVKYIGEQEAARLARPLLPGPGQTSFKEPQPTFYTTPGGKTSPVLSEATDIAAVESGAAKRPTTDKRLKSFRARAEEAQRLRDFYDPNEKLPVIKAGRKPKPKPKSLNDIEF